MVNYPTDNRKIMIAGNVNWSIFLRDTNSTLNEFAGVLVVCDTNNTASNFNRLRVGQLVEMTVKVTNFPVNNLGAIRLAGHAVARLLKNLGGRGAGGHRDPGLLQDIVERHIHQEQRGAGERVAARSRRRQAADDLEGGAIAGRGRRYHAGC